MEIPIPRLEYANQNIPHEIEYMHTHTPIHMHFANEILSIYKILIWMDTHLTTFHGNVCVFVRIW